MPHTVNSTSFKKGQMAWNKKEWIDLMCPICSRAYSVPPNRSDSKTCSPKCRGEFMSKNSVTEKILELYHQGVTAKNIAIAVNRKLPSIYSAIHTRLYRFRKGELSNSRRKYNFIKGKSCLICGESRCLDAAHIIPARDGGYYTEDNLMPLCPNHHRLFDRKKLSDEELSKIKDIIINRINNAS